MINENTNSDAKSTSVDEIVLIIKMFTSLDVYFFRRSRSCKSDSSCR